MAQAGETVISMPWGGEVTVPRGRAPVPVLRSAQDLLVEAEATPPPARGELALPPKRWVEWIARGNSTGASTFLDGLLRRARVEGRFSALVDPARTFEPATLSPGAAEALLWVRCPDLHRALRALDILLRDPNFGLVAADFRGVAAKGVAATSWYRLQRLVHQRSGTFLSLADRPFAPSADARHEIHTRWTLAELELPRQALHRKAAQRFAATAEGGNQGEERTVAYAAS
ncbi:MAG: hypothetical protein ACFB21_06230 [Opitutales bacterium]